MAKGLIVIMEDNNDLNIAFYFSLFLSYDNNIENEFYKDLFEDNVVVEDLKVFLFASDKVFFDKYHISREELLR